MTSRRGLEPVLVAVLVALLAHRAAAADFGYLKVKGGPTTGNQPYGAVTLVSPFSSETEGAIPLLLLVDAGDFARPWLRAKHVARLLPKVVELLLYKGEILKVGPDEDGNPSIYVGPPNRPVSKTDLKVVSVLPGDRDRFERERSERRQLSCTAVAHYWKALLEDEIAIFVRYPLSRDHRCFTRLKLARTRVGAIFKRILVEVGILLRFDDLPEERASPEILRAKLVETLQSFGRDRWSQLTRLAFAIPEDFALPTGADPAPVERVRARRDPSPAPQANAECPESPGESRYEPSEAGPGPDGAPVKRPWD